MNQELWTAVDEYFVDHLLPSDTILEAAFRRSEENGLPAIQVSAPQGKLLHLLARIQGAKRILEIGTLGGYSTIWLARALPSDGRLITLEYEPAYARVAAENLSAAGLQQTVEIRVGPALDHLPALEREEPFDLVFIDADKRNNPNYLAWALKLTRTGSLIIVDNVVRNGQILETDKNDESVQGTRAMFEQIASQTGVSATALQTVGSKGYDGFVLARVN